MKNEKVNIVLALLIAIGLWTYVVGIENPEKEVQIRDVPISFVNAAALEEEGLTLLSVSDSAVDVQISGRRSEIKNVNREDIKITADLEGYKEGEHIVRLQIGRITNVEIESKQKISIVVDQLVTEEKQVVVSLDGTVSDEREPYIVQVNPDTVNVTGAKTLVSSIVKLDAPLDVGRVGAELKSFTVNLRPLDQNGEEVNNVNCDVNSVSISAVNLSKKTVQMEIPIIGQNHDTVERTLSMPKTITIKGLDADLRKIDVIQTEPLDLTEVFENTTLRIVPILPKGVEAASNSQNLQAQIIVHGMGTRTFEYKKEAVVAEGVADNMTVTVDDVDIRLTVTGREPVVESLSADDFSFIVNVRNLKPGKHQVILNCRFNEELRFVKYTPETISLLIETPEEPSEEPEVPKENHGGEPEQGTEEDSTDETDEETGPENDTETSAEPEPYPDMDAGGEDNGEQNSKPEA